MINYCIAKEYTEIPGPRHKNEGDFSGEDFRERVLIPLFQEAESLNTTILMDLDGGYGYPTSFLEEAFGGLVRAIKRPISSRFQFKSDEEPALIDEIKDYIAAEEKKLK